ncbi:aconitate hydratase [bacterium]|nr:aconitate hydratase [bacterium]
MGMNVAKKLIASHLVSGEMVIGQEIGIRIDQTLTQDATGTMVMLELEAMGLKRARTELSCQYVDHNLIQEDNKNPDDHLFLYSACQRFGVWYSRPGNGVSHPVHMERFGRPGVTLLGSDSHTPGAGALGQLAIGAGGLEVALAIAGQPFFFKMPQIWGVKLTGKLPDWVSAKDVILEMLRRYTVAGGLGRIIEYYGPGLECLSTMDRHVIANMGAELGATTTVFPADDEVKAFMKSQGRESEFSYLLPDTEGDYDVHDEIDLSTLEPLIAMPSSPDNVKYVREVAGTPIYQSYIGSSANPGYKDLAIPAEIVRGRTIHPRVSFDVNPASRQVLENLVRDGYMMPLIHSGGRVHQAGCNGCIGMGQAPATKEISLRTVPRNFPGRSGTMDDLVCLVSPETAAASALTGVITDPRDLGKANGHPAMEYPRITEPADPIINTTMLVAPPPQEEAEKIELRKGPNIMSLPPITPIEDEISLPVMIKLGDKISTDSISPAGARALPFRSNIPRIAQFCFEREDPSYHDRAVAVRELGGHIIVGGETYGQGSSREHAALAPRFLGCRVVLTKSFARIHRSNLVNFGILPLNFVDKADYDKIEQGDILHIQGIRAQIAAGQQVKVTNQRTGETLTVQHDLSERQVEVLLKGGLINWIKERL